MFVVIRPFRWLLWIAMLGAVGFWLVRNGLQLGLGHMAATGAAFLVLALWLLLVWLRLVDRLAQNIFGRSL
jgi:hypothetical protein